MDEGKKEAWITLRPGLVNGVKAFFSTATTRGGRKATARAILSSDEQQVSDTGRKQRNYTITIYISALYEKGPFADSKWQISQDYLERRTAILAALEGPEPFSITHPWEGEITDLVCVDFDLSEEITSVGVGRITCELIRKTVGVVPVEQEGTAATVRNLQEDVDTSLSAMLASAWNVDPALIKQAENAIAKLEAGYAQVEAVADTVQQVAQAVNGFASAISDAVAEVAGIITSPLQVITSIQNVLTAMDNIFPTLDAAFTALQTGFDFGEDGNDSPATTPNLIQQRANDDALNTVFQASFLSRAYVAATELDLSTIARIEDVEAILDAQHERVVTGRGATPEVNEAMYAIRTAFAAFLRDQRSQAFDTATILVGTTTPRLLAYQLYESDERAGDLRALNSAANYQTLRGEVTVLTR